MGPAYYVMEWSKRKLQGTLAESKASVSNRSGKAILFFKQRIDGKKIRGNGRQRRAYLRLPKLHKTDHRTRNFLKKLQGILAYNVLEFGKKKERQEKQQAKKSDRVNVAGSTVNTWNFETELKTQTLTAMDCISLSVACVRGIRSVWRYHGLLRKEAVSFWYKMLSILQKKILIET